MYIAATKFDADDNVAEMGTSKRSFCTECSSMLWNYHDEWPEVGFSSSSSNLARLHGR
jgi:hypothetical protein